MSSLKESTIKGTFWTFLEEFSGKIFGFVIQIILARLLMPEDFGLLAMVIVFIGIGSSIVDSGFGQSLIRTKDPSQADYSSVFYLNVTISLIVYILIYLLAPYISAFYDESKLTYILRVIALVLIIKSFSIVQQTVLTIKLDFKKQMIVNLIATVVSGSAGALLAFNDYGVWSLVFMQIITASISTILFWYFGKWKPILIFDFNKVRYHYSFGYKLMLNTFVNSIFNYSFDIVIGKYYSASILGY